MDHAAYAGEYAQRLASVLAGQDWTNVGQLADELRACRESGRQVFLCGNGGSAGNAILIAKDAADAAFDEATPASVAFSTRLLKGVKAIPVTNTSV